MIGEIFKNIDASEKEIAETLSKMIRIKSISPELGGEGESKRAEWLASILKGFDEIKLWNYESENFPGIKRTSVTAVKHGKKKGTFWIVSHIDTVAAGNESEWKIPPFEGRIQNGNVYGRGSEDDGEAVVASIFAAHQFFDKKFEGMSLGLALVADEELGSDYGIEALIKEGIFSNDDQIFVPDHASVNNDKIEVVEKSVFWPEVTIYGKSAHGSVPELGINPLYPMIEIVADIKNLAKKYDAVDDRFENPKCTFEFTKIVAPTAGTNAIPPKAEFALDCRILPCYSVRELKKEVDAIIEKHRKTTEAKLEVGYHMFDTGTESTEDSALYRSLKSAIELVLDKKSVTSNGSCGATCASPFRIKGLSAYVWVMYNNTLHQVDEFVPIEHLVIDTKVFAKLIYDLCFSSQKDD